jgi:hypothetical protein
MRRVLSQCRLSLLEIDSDEDEAEEEEDEDQSDGSNSSQRYCSTHGPICLFIPCLLYARKLQEWAK